MKKTRKPVKRKHKQFFCEKNKRQKNRERRDKLRRLMGSFIAFSRKDFEVDKTLKIFYQKK